MSDFFGVASKEDCVLDVFFGVNYHSYLNARRGGMAIHGERGLAHAIHNIGNPPFRTKLEKGIEKLDGNLGIGCISDNEARPLLIESHLGSFAITTVGRINNLKELQSLCFGRGVTYSLEMSTGGMNPTELITSLVSHKATIIEDLQYVQSLVKDSMSILLVTQYGIYVARDLLGRTPIVLGEGEAGFCATFGSSVFLNLGCHHYRDLGAGEIVFITLERIEILRKPREEMKTCFSLWVYYGYPTSTYEGISVECIRNRCGELLTGRDDVEMNGVTGVPDSGTAHAVGYSNVSSVPFVRPFIKYTPTQSGSFVPTGQMQQNMAARIRLIPVQELVRDKCLLLIDDSIVRGAQLGKTTEFLHESDAREIHVCPVCPPIIFGYKYLNFSRLKSETDLTIRRVIHKLEGDDVSSEILAEYTDPDSERYQKMCEEVRQRSNSTSLRYHHLDDMIASIGLDKCELYTYCWDGREGDEEQGKEALSAF